MHEWALAEAVIEAVIENIGSSSTIKDIKRVVVAFGELQNIDMEIFRFGLENLLKSKFVPDDSAEQNNNLLDFFVFEEEEAVFKCNSCNYQWSLSDNVELNEEEREAIHFLPESAHVYIKCPNCGSRDFVFIAGRGVTIRSIELKG